MHLLPSGLFTPSPFPSLLFPRSSFTHSPFPSRQYCVSSTHYCASPFQYLLPLDRRAPSAPRHIGGLAKLTRFKVIRAAPVPLKPRPSSGGSYARDTHDHFHSSIFSFRAGSGIPGPVRESCQHMLLVDCIVNIDSLHPLVMVIFVHADHERIVIINSSILQVIVGYHLSTNKEAQEIFMASNFNRKIFINLRLIQRRLIA